MPVAQDLHVKLSADALEFVQSKVSALEARTRVERVGRWCRERASSGSFDCVHRRVRDGLRSG